MRFFQYLLFRIGAKQSEKAIYYSIDQISKYSLDTQFPSLLKSVIGGFFGSLGLLVFYGIFSWILGSPLNIIIVIVLGLILSIELFFRKYTLGTKIVSKKISDKRYKVGYCFEKKTVEDPETLVALSAKHKWILRFEGFIYIISIVLIFYLHFRVYKS